MTDPHPSFPLLNSIKEFGERGYREGGREGGERERERERESKRERDGDIERERERERGEGRGGQRERESWSDVKRSKLLGERHLIMNQKNLKENRQKC